MSPIGPCDTSIHVPLLSTCHFCSRATSAHVSLLSACHFCPRVTSAHVSLRRWVSPLIKRSFSWSARRLSTRRQCCRPLILTTNELMNGVRLRWQAMLPSLRECATLAIFSQVCAELRTRLIPDAPHRETTDSRPVITHTHKHTPHATCHVITGAGARVDRAQGAINIQLSGPR